MPVTGTRPTTHVGEYSARVRDVGNLWYTRARPCARVWLGYVCVPDWWRSCCKLDVATGNVIQASSPPHTPHRRSVVDGRDVFNGHPSPSSMYALRIQENTINCSHPPGRSPVLANAGPVTV